MSVRPTSRTTSTHHISPPLCLESRSSACSSLSAGKAATCNGPPASVRRVSVKQVIPIAMLHISDPDYSVIDILSKLSHDHDAGVSMAATFALGLVGAGTNNSRVAQLLRQLSSFYAKEADHLYCVRPRRVSFTWAKV